MCCNVFKYVSISCLFLLISAKGIAQDFPYDALDADGKMASCVAYSVDGRLASASREGKIYFWNTATKASDNVLNDHKDIILALTFSPDGTLLASGGKDKTVLIWSVNGGVVKYRCNGHADAITSLSFSMDGKYLASGSADNTIKIWEVATGKLSQTLTYHKKEVSSVCFSKTSNLLASGSYDGTIKLYNLTTNQIEKQFSPNAGKVRAVALSSNDRLIAAGLDDKTIKLWELSTGNLKKIFTGHPGNIYDIEFSPDGLYLASGCFNNEVKIWSLELAENITTFKGFYKFLSLSFSKDGKNLAVADFNQKLRVYDVSKLHIKPDSDYIKWSKSGKVSGLVSAAPQISIIDPVTSRADILKTEARTLTIQGNIKSENGIFLVLVDGSETSVDADGKFTKEVRLKYFENDIIIKAIDIDKKVKEDTIHVFRIFDKKNQDEVAGTKRRGKDYALIIATDQYDFMNQLSNPVNDAKTIAAELKEYYGYTVDELFNPTLNEIYAAIRKYNKMQFADDDQLFIFIAGHGEYDDVFREGYIVAKDSKKGDESKVSYLSHSNLRTLVNNIPCKHICLTLDACFGGTFDQSMSARGDDGMYNGISKDEFVVRKLKYKTRLYLTSGGKEYVPDGRPGQHSPFARKFLEALRSYGGEDGILTMRETLNYVDKVQPEPRNGEFGDNQPGSDFLFIKKN